MKLWTNLMQGESGPDLLARPVIGSSWVQSMGSQFPCPWLLFWIWFWVLVLGSFLLWMFLRDKVRLNLGILDWERNPLLWRSFLPKSINKCQESHCSQSSIDELILVVRFILPLGVSSPRVRVSAETFIVPQHFWRILPSMNSKFRVGLERAYVTLLASSHFFTTQYLATHNKVAPTIKIPH